MTTIDKLLIQGIRSFSPQNKNIVEFYKPLTLIVGQNGAGKTTIIECLLYSATGEMPPNAKNGQAFVHDPKIAGEREVKAQVKLKFKTPNGVPIVCTRSLQLTQMPGHRQQIKSLEGAIQTYNSEGQKVSKSFRCVDIDREIPELMGVSKPILEYVIFCHQEESNWPLSEPSSLKKIFDEIFAATGYTKALDALKKQRKEHANKIREMKLQLETLQAHKDQSSKVKANLSAGREKLHQYKVEIRSLNEKITKIESLLDEKKKVHQKEQKLAEDYKQTKREYEYQVRETERLLANLQPEFEEPLDELINIQENFEQKLKELENKANSIENERMLIESKKEGTEKKMQNVELQIATKRSLTEKYNQLLSERDNLLFPFIKRYKLQGFDSGPFDWNLFSQKADAITQTFQHKVAEFRREIDSINSSFVEKLDTLRNQLNTVNYSSIQKQKQQRENSQKIKEIQQERSENQHISETISKYEQKLAEEANILNRLKKNYEPQVQAKKLDALKLEQKRLDEQALDLNSALKQLTVHSSARARLELKTNQLKKLTAESQAAIDKVKSEAKKYLDKNDSDPLQMKARIEKLRSAKQLKIDSISSQLQKNKLRSSSISGQKKSTEQTIQLNKTRLAEKIALLKPVSKDEKPLPTLIEEVETNIVRQTKDIAIAKSASVMYQKYIEQANAHHNCPLCKRHFEKKDDLSVFVDKMNKTVTQVPASLEQHENSLQEAQELINTLRGLRTDWDEKQRLESNILPALNQQLSSLESDQVGVNAEISQLSVELDGLSSEEKELGRAISSLDEVCRLYERFQTLSKEVHEEKESLKREVNDTRTVDEVSKEYEACHRKSQELGQQIETLSKEAQQKQAEIHKHETESLAIKEKIIDYKSRIESFSRREALLEELLSSNKTLESELHELQDQVLKKQGQITEVTNEKNETEEVNRSKMEIAQKEQDLLRSKRLELNSLQRQITEIEEEDITMSLKTLERSKQELVQTIMSLKQESDGLLNEQGALREKVLTSEVYKRNIADNIKYKQMQANLIKLEARLKSKEASLQIAVTDQVEADLATSESDLKNATSKRDQFIGSYKSCKEHIEVITVDLARPIYKTVEEDYRKLIIQLKTTEMASNDIDKYHSALEKALMKFHSIKMEEINKIIKELWQTTYKGNDIDTIQIHADLESTTAKRAYNYKVVMIKGGTELEMRGRCSAGQKVIASLIIRLALAETFCLNCGLLSLDEPTTNLDRYNVESFANALVNIIDARRGQSNFQLIVITHDEEFVQLLGRSEHTDSYWRVTKDSSQHSTVERQDIRDLD